MEEVKKDEIQEKINLLEQMKAFKEELELTINPEITKINDIIYNGKIILEPKEEEKEPEEKFLYVVLKQKDEKQEYEIYADNMLIAKENEDGIIEVTEEFKQKYKNINSIYKVLSTDEKESLNELEKEISKDEKEKTPKKQEEKSSKKQEDELSEEEEKREKVAQKQGVRPEDIRGYRQIDPNQKITDKESLKDIFPEAKDFSEIIVTCVGDAFTFMGIDKDGNMQEFNRLKPTQGINTGKTVMSINKDGSKVEEKQVKALVLDGKNPTQGLSVKIGQYGIIEADYIRRSKTENKYMSIPLQTDRDGTQKVEYDVRKTMNRAKNTDITDEYDRAKQELEAHPDEEITTKDIDENLDNDSKIHDDVTILKDGTEIPNELINTFANNNKITREENLRLLNGKKGTIDERFEEVEEDLEQQYGAPTKDI